MADDEAKAVVRYKPRVAVNGATGRAVDPDERPAAVVSRGGTDTPFGRLLNQQAYRAWQLLESDADAELSDLGALRTAAYDLYRRDALVRGALSTHSRDTIGSGLTLQPVPRFAALRRAGVEISESDENAIRREIADHFAAWAENPRACTVEGVDDFNGAQQTLYASDFLAGDGLAILTSGRRDRDGHMLQIQLVDPARLCNENDELNARNTSRSSGGVIRNERGRVVAYSILSKHPHTSRLDGQAPRKWTRVSAYGQITGRPNVLHVAERWRPGQSRGVTALEPVLGVVKQLSRLREAEVIKAVIQSFLTVILETPDGNPLGFGEETTNMGRGERPQRQPMELGSGTILQTQPGQKVQIVDPSRGGSELDAFFRALHRQVGVGIDLPYEVLIQHFESSYSAARAALLSAFQKAQVRRSRFARQAAQPVYVAWLMEMAARDRFTFELTGFFDRNRPDIRAAWTAANWIGPTMGQIDPLKEMKAEQVRLELLVSSRDDVSRRVEGRPWTLDAIVGEVELLQDVIEARPDLADALRPLLTGETSPADSPPDQDNDAAEGAET